jgi:3D (Asp-Asp-Asp) domain-containing protein
VNSCCRRVRVSRATDRNARRVLHSFVGWLVLFGGGAPLYAQNLSARPFVITAYCQAGITKSGIHTGPGVAAGDPRYLPLGSIVTVSNEEASSDVDVYTVVDTGSKVKGQHLDVFTPDCNSARRFGRRRRPLTILRFGWRTQLAPLLAFIPPLGVRR